MSLQSLSSAERSKNLFIQISSSFLIKAALFFITYAQFPVFNNFLSKEEFGLWVTFISFYNWFILFDFGIGYGLKNILTEKLSLDDKSSLKEYSSSGTTGTLLVAAIFVLLFEFLKSDILFSNKLATSINEEVLRKSINFTFYSCIILFLHNTFSSFMYSVQKASYPNYLNLMVNASLLVLILLMNTNLVQFFATNSLVFLSEINFLFYLLFFTLISILFFRKYPIFIPDFKKMSFTSFKYVLSKGSKFFFIQISLLIIYPIDSFILTKYISPTTAADYNVIIKIFSILLVAGSVFNQSSWPSMTEAYYKKDYKWLKKLFGKLLLIYVFLISTLVLFSFYLNEIIHVWIDNTYNFSFKIISLAAILHILYLIVIALATILYSTNYLKSQIIIGSIIIPLKVILIYILVIKNQYGFEGLLMSSLICFLIFTIYNIYIFIKKFKIVWAKN